MHYRLLFMTGRMRAQEYIHNAFLFTLTYRLSWPLWDSWLQASCSFASWQEKTISVCRGVKSRGRSSLFTWNTIVSSSWFRHTRVLVLCVLATLYPLIVKSLVVNYYIIQHHLDSRCLPIRASRTLNPQFPSVILNNKKKKERNKE